MTLSQALKMDQWVRRRGWGAWLFAGKHWTVGQGGAGWARLTYDDLVADDRTPHMQHRSDEPEDEATLRFSLLELDED